MHRAALAAFGRLAQEEFSCDVVWLWLQFLDHLLPTRDYSSLPRGWAQLIEAEAGRSDTTTLLRELAALKAADNTPEQCSVWAAEHFGAMLLLSGSIAASCCSLDHPSAALALSSQPGAAAEALVVSLQKECSLDDAERAVKLLCTVKESSVEACAQVQVVLRQSGRVAQEGVGQVLIWLLGGGECQCTAQLERSLGRESTASTLTQFFRAVVAACEVLHDLHDAVAMAAVVGKLVVARQTEATIALSQINGSSSWVLTVLQSCVVGEALGLDRSQQQ